ncbi:hypothetical protein GS18_0206540 [Metabacillus indicus]|uniref:Uncharacterized protein n=1 Tax=Metabacillus indicus TaxID=246786 RepID=A0A084H0Z6_METID|nr:hypothetical protein GS18_0206540 [Metabacillus indicus]
MTPCPAAALRLICQNKIPQKGGTRTFRVIYYLTAGAKRALPLFYGMKRAREIPQAQLRKLPALPEVIL